MSKKINWDNDYKSPMRGKVTPNGKSYSNRKEQISQAYANLKKAEKASEEFRKIEPLLKSLLLEHMVQRLPITVEAPMYYFAEELKKSEEEDDIDRAYYNRSRESESISTFQVIKKAIEPGTVLTFKRTNEAFGQWIFKSSTGEEVEIYNTPIVDVPGGFGGTQSVQNPGFWGLLMATNIYREVIESLNTEEA